MKESKGLENKDQAEEQGCRGMVVCLMFMDCQNSLDDWLLENPFARLLNLGQRLKNKKIIQGAAKKK